MPRPPVDPARDLYGSLNALVFQAVTALSADASKTSYGSAFAVSADGLLATNFHVVRSVLSARDLKVFVIGTGDKNPVQAEIVGVDAIHDLALLKIPRSFAKFFKFRTDPLAVGQRSFSMGLPKDTTMSIIEGVYNGEKQRSIYSTLVLSTPLNAGMSGGPTLDERGDVIGVNVAIQRDSNSLSFAVPAKFVERLMASLQSAQLMRSPASVAAPPVGRDLKKDILNQLKSAQSEMTEEILNSANLPKIAFGKWKVPGNVPSLDCWRKENQVETLGAAVDNQLCFVPHQVELTDELRLGDYAFVVSSVTRQSERNSFSLVEQNALVPRGDPSQYASAKNPREELARVCRKLPLVNKSGVVFAVSYCLQAYRNLPSLYFGYLKAVAVGASERDLLSLQFTLRGFERESLKKAMFSFLDGVERTQP